jgi:hypothetical protein
LRLPSLEMLRHVVSWMCLNFSAETALSIFRVRYCNPVKYCYQYMELHGVISQQYRKNFILVLFIPYIIVQFPVSTNKFTQLAMTTVFICWLKLWTQNFHIHGDLILR